MPFNPGVYRMLDAKGDALYVGKARSLKKRVTAYTQVGRLDERLRRMVNETAAMEVITTHTEAEALLLEANLIKRLKPRFNIVLRDDKSYPWLMLTEDHPFPQIAKHRGAQVRKGSYWGPFASRLGGEPDGHRDAARVPAALLRRHGVRQPHPALPAVPDPPLLGALRGAASARRTTAGLVGQAKAFLAGKSATVQQELAAEMEHAAEALEFEHAAAVRDRIRALTFVQGSDVVNPASLRDADVIAAWQTAGPDLRAGVLRPRRAQQRQPRVLPDARQGGRRPARCWPPSSPSSTTTSRRRPACWLNHTLPEQDLVAEALSLKADRKVEILRAAARREARGGAARRDQRARGVGTQAGRERRRRRSCSTASRSCSVCRRRRSASRSTTTRTSWAPTRTA